MKKDTKRILLVAGVALLLFFGLNSLQAGIAPAGEGKINMYIIDGNNNPIQGAYCEVYRPMQSGYSSLTVKDRSASTGWCSFTGYTFQAGELHNWAVSCASPTGIHKQSPPSIQPITGQTTRNTIQLPGCTSVVVAVTTSTTLPCIPNGQLVPLNKNACCSKCGSVDAPMSQMSGFTMYRCAACSASTTTHTTVTTVTTHTTQTTATTHPTTTTTGTGTTTSTTLVCPGITTSSGCVSYTILAITGLSIAGLLWFLMGKR